MYILCVIIFVVNSLRDYVVNVNYLISSVDSASSTNYFSLLFVICYLLPAKTTSGAPIGIYLLIHNDVNTIIHPTNK